LVFGLDLVLTKRPAALFYQNNGPLLYKDTKFGADEQTLATVLGAYLKHHSSQGA
jgi:hypothetical protein